MLLRSGGGALVCYGDGDGVGGNGGSAGGFGRELLRGFIADGVVGVEGSVRADLIEQGFDFGGVDGLVDERGEEALDGEGGGTVRGGDADAEDGAGGAVDEGGCGGRGRRTSRRPRGRT